MWRERNRYMILLLQGEGGYTIETQYHRLVHELKGQIAYFKGFVRRYYTDPSLQVFEIPLDYETPDIAEYWVQERSGDLLTQLRDRLDAIRADLEQAITQYKSLRAGAMVVAGYYGPTGDIKELVTDSVGRLNIATAETGAFDVQVWYTSITATDNKSGFALGLFTRKPRISFWTRCGGACNVNVYVSRNNADWRLVKTYTLPSAGSITDYFETAYPYVKIEVPTTGIDVEIEACAKR